MVQFNRPLRKKREGGKGRRDVEERRMFKKVKNWDVETHASLDPRSDRGVLLRSAFPSIPLSSTEIRDPTAAISAREFAQERGRKEEWGTGKVGEGREKRSLALQRRLSGDDDR